VIRHRDWLALAAAGLLGLTPFAAAAADGGTPATAKAPPASSKGAAADGAQANGAQANGAQANGAQANGASPGGAVPTSGQDPDPGDPSADPDGTDPGDEEEEMPAGHPAVEGNPHGAAAAPPGVFQPPADKSKEDPSLPAGTIAVELRDADDRPVPHETVNLGILINSVAKGDSRKHMQATTDDQGVATFAGLETLSNIAYRVSSGYQGGSFAATPFQLSQGKAMRVVLHVYPVTRDLRSALIVSQAIVAAELRDDRLQIEEQLSLYNLGRFAWQPDEVRMALPAGYTAFGTQASMSDIGVDDVKGAAQIHGTFPPGQSTIEFRWQLPWSGDADVDFSVGLPPHTAIVRLMMPATANVKLVATGLPPAEVRQNGQGQSFLVTEKRLTQDDPRLTTLAIGIHDLPTPGPGRTVATVLAALGVAVGIFLATAGRPRSGPRKPGRNEREALLEEIADLEHAHTLGDVGPSTYESARRDLIDALARTLAPS
jgi:hypothetical protein